MAARAEGEVRHEFLVLKGQDIRDQFGVNQWLDRSRIITSFDLAKRQEILPGLRQVHWDLVIVDGAALGPSEPAFLTKMKNRRAKANKDANR